MISSAELEKLESKLKSVKDTYEDFVSGLMYIVNNRPEYAAKITDYIDENSDTTTSEVIQYLDELRGIPIIDTSKIPNLYTGKFK